MTNDVGDGTVGKALQVLEQVADFGRPVRFSDVLAASAYPKPTLYRLLQTLTNQGMLSHDPDSGMYAPGARLVRLAHAAWQQSSLAQVAGPHLEKLSATTGETVHLAQIDAGQVLYLDKHNAAQPIEMYSQAGKVGPAYCTGVGKAMMAFLSKAELDNVIAQQSFHIFTPQTIPSSAALRAELAEIKTNGYGFDREEHEPGIICVAMPILTANNRVLGALSVTSTTARINLAGLEAHVPSLREAATAIAGEAQRWSSPDTQTTQTTGMQLCPVSQ